MFTLEPMFAKMILPVLGGTPAIWNTCMVFYQATLLAGYAYANVSTKAPPSPRRAVIQLAILFVPLAVLPIHLPHAWVPPTENNPIPWLILVLAAAIGLPFFCLATITLVLQKWFVDVEHASARDPYFLYAASNIGSMFGLLCYPLIIEPHLGLRDQSFVWTLGYGLLVVLMAICATVSCRSPRILSHESVQDDPSLNIDEIPSTNQVSIGWRLRLRWLALAFAPASLMLGVTTVLTTEIPPIPLFWLAPLAVYLLSFILVFAKKQVVSHDQMVERLPFLVLAALIPVFSKTQLPIWMELILNLVTLFVAAMVCHGELAKTRPGTEHLTEFFLWISLGGVLGGMFNAFLAPFVFRTLQEFPLALIMAAMLRPVATSSITKTRWLDLSLPVLLGSAVVILIEVVKKTRLEGGPILHLVIFAPAMLLCLSFGKRPLRFALTAFALWIASSFYVGPYGHILHSQRSFFGVYRVTNDPEEKYRLLFHGTTIHGMQSLGTLNNLQPLSYFTRSGPIGQVFSEFEGTDILQRVAIIGLGAGSMACYAQTGQEFTFYEIDPAVERIARNPQYFTFLRDCAPGANVTIGDARLSLNKVANHHYGLIILDAFGSDAIPVHLLTREAIDVYLSKLRNNGVLVFHITNRYLDLQPVLGAVARDANLVCFAENDAAISEAEIRQGKFPSRWAVMARNTNDLGNLARDPRWVRAVANAGTRVWKDDFSSVLKALSWN